jgi:hypothetical protein
MLAHDAAKLITGGTVSSTADITSWIRCLWRDVLALPRLLMHRAFCKIRTPPL